MILDKAIATVRRYAMLEAGDRVVVAVSGGPDSVALLHVLLDIRGTMGLALTVAHLDHALRGADSDADRAYVEDLAERLGLPCHARREEVAALARRERRSLEEAGRIARRRFLREVAETTGARRVALGHHREDQAESVLLRLIAGSGLGGLSGVRPVADGLFVRPLFDCSRAEIVDYLESRTIASREDETNADVRFPRNRIRHTVLPLLREGFNPRVSEAIARTADILREEDAYLDRRARRLLTRMCMAGPGETVPSSSPRHAPRAGTSDGSATSQVPWPQSATADVLAPADAEPLPRNSAPRAGSQSDGGSLATLRIDATRLQRLPSPIARRVVRLALRRAGLKGRDFARARIDEVLSLASGGEHRSLSLGEAFTARFEYGQLLFERRSRGAAGPPRVLERLEIPGEAALAAVGVSIRTAVVPRAEIADEYLRAPSHRAYVDADWLRPPLCVRSPRPGDRFHPLGAPGSRKLSDLWTDQKLGRDARRRCLVVESEGRIVWAVGLRLADPFRVTDATTNVAVLEVVDLPKEATESDALEPRLDTPGVRTAPKPAGGPTPILYTEAQIRSTVERLAGEVAAWAAGRDIVVLGVLQGSFIFLADLVRGLPGPIQIAFLDREGEPIRPFPSISGERVLLVEDILDTGESLVRILERLRQAAPAEIRTCVLLDKPSGRRAPVEADWRGLVVPDRWVVGYGLDVEGRERNLPYLTWI